MVVICNDKNVLVVGVAYKPNVADVERLLPN
jgi:UDP-N-acetyl-D-mannosaminuronate dehydrogenase